MLEVEGIFPGKHPSPVENSGCGAAYMADFSTSSQKKRWIFSAEEIHSKRASCNKKSAEALIKFGSTDLDAQAGLPDTGRAEGGLPGAGPSQGGAAPALPAVLSVADEAVLRRHYEGKLQPVCKAFSFPHKIQATALLYFKRFYLHHSVMDVDPKDIMLTCVYLACKVEESHVSADEFGKGIKQDPAAVLKNELPVLQALDFDLIVFPPYRALEGFCHDMEERSLVSSEERAAASTSGRDWLDEAMRTDASLMFLPGQIALAALRVYAQRERKERITGYVKETLERLQGAESLDRLSATLDDITAMVSSAGPLPEVAAVQKLDRQGKFCRKPELWRELESRKREEKKARKQQQKQKRASHDVQSREAPPEEDPAASQDMKRRKSEPAGSAAPPGT
ncbi:Cyclin family protein [Klebsormidium nitens]|uniref:Cyclin family protein n=1 Tax=Klebsormidium nitens TaxID=105231 RepID=A0A1Y1I4X4_KLENI|nr:Cyclin family protein [Klebsormidium nitens]|eukprot:GAQ83756.1 Cyclin family protein [Klebsormidium nitens]